MENDHRGIRWPNGEIVVLCPKGKYVRRDSNRMTWGDESSSSEALAFGILLYHLGSYMNALTLCRPFLRKVVAKLPDKCWILTESQIDAAIGEIEAEPLHDHDEVVEELG